MRCERFGKFIKFTRESSHENFYLVIGNYLRNIQEIDENCWIFDDGDVDQDLMVSWYENTLSCYDQSGPGDIGEISKQLRTDMFEYDDYGKDCETYVTHDDWDEGTEFVCIEAVCSIQQTVFENGLFIGKPLVLLTYDEMRMRGMTFSNPYPEWETEDAVMVKGMYEEDEE